MRWGQAMKNVEVAAMLNRIADLLEIKGENFFKIRAYREAVRQLDNLTTEVEAMIRGGRLRDVPGGRRAKVAGSRRRARETVGDIDLLVAAADPVTMCAAFARLPQAAEVIAQGGTRTSLRLRSGMQVDLRAVTPDQFGAAWQYFTGSQAHNVQLRSRSERMGRLKINEYGVFREDGTRLAGETEEEVYAAVGCAWIPPEIREGMGEIDAAAGGPLPALLQAGDLEGELHAHSRSSGGRSDVATTASAAQGRGYRYMALTDHTQSLTIANGLTPQRFAPRAAQN